MLQSLKSRNSLTIEAQHSKISGCDIENSCFPGELPWRPENRSYCAESAQLGRFYADRQDIKEKLMARLAGAAWRSFDRYDLVCFGFRRQEFEGEGRRLEQNFFANSRCGKDNSCCNISSDGGVVVGVVDVLGLTILLFPPRAAELGWQLSPADVGCGQYFHRGIRARPCLRGDRCCADPR